MAGLRGQVREPRETARGRRNSANLSTNAQFVSSGEVIGIDDEGRLILRLDDPSGLENNAGKLRIDVENESLVISSAGIKVQLATDPALEVVVGEGLQVKPKTDGGLDKDSDGLFIDFAAIPGLEIVVGDGLQAKLKTDGGLDKDAGGIFIDLAARSGLEILAGDGLAIGLATVPGLRINEGGKLEVNPADGISITTGGVGICLAAESGLEFAEGSVLNDSSGNNRTLTETGDLNVVVSAQPKYGEGLSGFSATDFLQNSDSAFQITGDLSITTSFKLDNLATTQVLLSLIGVPSSETEANNALYQIVIFTDGSLAFTHEFSAGSNTTLITASGVIAAGTHNITVRRDATAKTFVVKLDGTEVFNSTYADNPTGGTAALLGIGAHAVDGSSPLIGGAVYEVRIWDSLVSQTTLDKIADPNDPDFTQSAEGTETGLWFFEGETCLRVKVAPQGGITRDATGLSISSVPRFTQTATATVANTVTETTLTAAGVGSLTLPANILIAGRTLRLRGMGVLSTDAILGHSLTLRIKVAGTVVGSTGSINWGAGLTNVGWMMDALITCRTTGATGTIFSQGRMHVGSEGLSPSTQAMPNTVTQTVDTTAALTIDITAEWNTADPDNSISCTNLTMETIN